MAITLTDAERKLARHALGLPNARNRSYRNRFVAAVCPGDYDKWLSMGDKGAASGMMASKNAVRFWLTFEGATAALLPGESLDHEDFPQGAQRKGEGSDGRAAVKDPLTATCTPPSSGHPAKENPMPEYQKHTPAPQPIRHTFRFSEDELIRALEWWLVAQGRGVPDGKRFVWGLEREAYRFGGDASVVTLVIDEAPAP